MQQNVTELFVGKVGALGGEGKQDCLDTEAVFLLLNQPYSMRKDDLAYLFSIKTERKTLMQKMTYNKQKSLQMDI